MAIQKLKSGSRKRIVIVILAVAVIIAFMVFLWNRKVSESGPKVFYESAEMVRGEEVEIDVKVKGIEGFYPAVSLEIAFDKNKLEFLELRQGNMEVVNQTTGETVIPEWQFSKESANREGAVKTMYLDMTGGDNPVSGDAIEEGSDIMFRLVFRVKDSCNEGEELVLTTKQATFAALEEKDSLAVYKENISVPEKSYAVKAK